MKTKTLPCIDCEISMKETLVNHKGLRLKALQCPKCKRSFFTEDLATHAIAQLEARRLSLEYNKHPIKI